MLQVPEPLFSRLLEVREVLMFSFDFELLEQPVDAQAYTTPSPWMPAFTVPGARAAVVGRDAMGGLYVLCEFASPPATRCVHLDTSGHVVVLGESLQEAVSLLIEVPYWRELLARDTANRLDSMRVEAQELEREVFDDLPNLPEARAYLQTFFAFAPAATDPVARLYELNRASDSITVLSPHGWRYESPVAHPPQAAL